MLPGVFLLLICKRERVHNIKDIEKVITYQLISNHRKISLIKIYILTNHVQAFM